MKKERKPINNNLILEIRKKRKSNVKIHLTLEEYNILLQVINKLDLIIDFVQFEDLYKLLITMPEIQPFKNKLTVRRLKHILYNENFKTIDHTNTQRIITYIDSCVKYYDRKIFFIQTINSMFNRKDTVKQLSYRLKENKFDMDGIHIVNLNTYMIKDDRYKNASLFKYNMLYNDLKNKFWELSKNDIIRIIANTHIYYNPEVLQKYKDSNMSVYKELKSYL